jgi:chromosome segregation ATPase
MILGLGDTAFPNDSPNQTTNTPIENALDNQIAALKLEIKTIEKEIQAHEAARQIDEEALKEKRRKEIADLTRQVNSFQKALDHEQKRVQHFQTEIARREGKLAEQQQILASQPDSEYYDEQVVSLNSQNEQLLNELRELRREIANEVGDDFDVDELLQSGGNERKRLEELQRLQAEYAKLQSQSVNERIKQTIEKAADRRAEGVDQLLGQKGELEEKNDTMRTKIQKTRAKCDSLEEASRALRMMDVLLTEKLEHDKELIYHLEEFQGQNPARATVLPDPETPPVTDEIVEQLRTQQMIIQGLFYKLGLAQRELATQTIPESFSFLVDQLDQLHGRCKMLQGSLLRREAAETQKIEAHIGEEDSQSSSMIKTPPCENDRC